MNGEVDVEGLQAKVLELQERLRRLEDLQYPSPSGGGRGGGNVGSSNGNRHHTRRDLLRVVGAAAIGAAGGVVLRPTPAAATDGNPVVLGNTDPAVNKVNDAAFTTT